MGDQKDTSEKLSELKRNTEHGGTQNQIPETKMQDHPILGLQRSLGNQKTIEFIQTKLLSGQSEDRLESEAERAADSALGLKGNKKPAALEKREGTYSNLPAGSGGIPLPRVTQSFMEERFKSDFNKVRVHNDGAADNVARELNARAFTRGNDIYFGAGRYQPETTQGKRLLAHELAHVVQQRSMPLSQGPKILRSIDRDNAGKSDSTGRKNDSPSVVQFKHDDKASQNTAPGVVEVDRPVFQPLGNTADFLNQLPDGERARVNVRFGKIARGAIEVNKFKGRYVFSKKAVPLTHPLFAGMKGMMKGLSPHIILSTGSDGAITGYVGVVPGNKNLSGQIVRSPELIGLKGFNLDKTVNFINEVKDGRLNFGLENASVVLDGFFSGSITFKLDPTDGKIVFDGNAEIKVKGLEEASLALKRTDEGSIQGQGGFRINLPKNISGEAKIAWDGEKISGEGKADYKGEKFSGSLVIRVMDVRQARLLQEEKGIPQKNSGRKENGYVVAGEGELDFAFSEWLSGTAHVIVDETGYLTVIGKISPQKEVLLFQQKDYGDKLFKVEARAGYGIPVVGNVFIFANVGAEAFARIGPAKLYNIEVEGTYTTDPEKSKDFTIKGSINISSAAGISIRAEAGAGLEVLDHDIKAGGAIDARAEIKAYADATPVIEYREKASEGRDKKGEFFIRGDMEIAAQPSLGLGGDVFVEVDAPWWSPVPDKRWTWPLVNKEWPIGGSFGVKASVDYVLGSEQVPKLEFKPAAFSADKFMTDLYSDKAKSKTKDVDTQKAAWAEKNTKGAEPPKENKKAGVKEVKAPEGLPKPLPKPAVTKKAGKAADPKARTAEGKTVKELQEEALRKGKRPDAKELKGADEVKKKEIKKEDHDIMLQEGLSALDAVTRRYSDTGASFEEVEAGVKSVRRKFKVFKHITVIDGGDTWDYDYAASPDKKRKGPVKKGKGEKLQEGTEKVSKLVENTLMLYGKGVKSVPSVKKGQFNKWFNSLTSDELDALWKNPILRATIEDRLRKPGSLHEWHLISRAPLFKRWGVTSEQIKDMRTLTKNTKFVNPKGIHGGKGSTTAHNELLDIIDSSLNYDMFKRRVQNWADYRLEGGASALPVGLKR